MPRRHADAAARILERFVLQPRGMKPKSAPYLEEALLVGAHQMRHRLVADLMVMKPHAAVEGEAHPLAAACELLIGRRYVQVIWPALVALPTGVATPWKR